MKKQIKTLGAVALAMTLVPQLYAEETIPLEVEVEQSYHSGGQEKVGDRIAADFYDFAGDDSATLTEALRTGDSLSYVVETEQLVLDEGGNPVLIEVINPDGTVAQIEKTETLEETIVVENSAGPLGFGGVVLAMGLAEASLPEGAEYKDIVSALFNEDTQQGILDMRVSGMGWGQIYREFDLKVGDIMSAKNSARPEKMDRVARNEKSNRPERADRPETVGRPDKPERPEKPQRPDKPGKPDKPEKPDKPGKPV